jgi:hypothetical protein
MAKKIRFFEREKGGKEAFLSPKLNERSRYYQSPELLKPQHSFYLNSHPRHNYL